MQRANAISWSENRKTGSVFMPDDDAPVIERAQQGDSAAFDLLFEKYQEYVYHIAYGIVGRTDEARDIAQDVFVQIYHALPRFRRGARFSTWLYRIAANRATDAVRSAERRQKLVSVMQKQNEDAERPFTSQIEEEDAVQQALMRCPIHHRRLLVLRYYRELDMEEIAAIEGCSLVAARVRLHRAKKEFTKQYTGSQTGIAETLEGEAG